MDKVRLLKKRLREVSPEHDTPVGKIHPYWARKPMNIIEEIIKSLSKKSDIILDPFMGSGTILFAACKNGRNAIGTDINPLSKFLVESIFYINSNPKFYIKKISKFVEEYSKEVLKWYKIPNQKNRYIDREHFNVNGEFDYGNFSLSINEIITKTYIDNKWRYRQKEESQVINNITAYPIDYLKYPVDFEKISLFENSRIAIPKGAKLSHYFTNRNIAAINYYLDKMMNDKRNSSSKKPYLFLLSSSLHLLRLSDKKNSSQWPYWRPKENLTSRNPVIIFHKKIQEMEKMTQWFQENFNEIHKVEINEIFNKKNKMTMVNTKEIPVQKLLNYIPLPESIDLLITDPPYSDYIPYLEYSMIWNSVLKLNTQNISFNSEIVKSNSSNRINDSYEYTKRLYIAFDTCCKIIKKEGYLVWFYLDYNLKHWSMIQKIAKKQKVRVIDILPIQKQRRSMKTVQSPGNTLDGDLICVFKKCDNNITNNKITIDEIIYDIEENLNNRKTDSLFEKYAYIIKYALINDCSDKLSEYSIDARKLLEKIS